MAHLDDDLLFMNPDIMTSIRAGNAVRTVYMIAMVAGDEDDYWRNRETGVEAAYAYMAGVDDHWIVRRFDVGGYVNHLAYLRDAPQISLVFLRLPDNADPRPGVVTFRRLDASNPATAIQSVDNVSCYTKDELVKHLTELITEFAPSVIRLQDWQTSEDFDRPTSDPERADHPDHIRTARIARLAAGNFKKPHVLHFYRNYNISYAAPNLAPDIVRQKRAVFLTYAQYDSLIGGDPKRPHATLFTDYEPWLERQYRALASPHGNAPS